VSHALGTQRTRSRGENLVGLECRQGSKVQTVEGVEALEAPPDAATQSR